MKKKSLLVLIFIFGNTFGILDYSRAVIEGQKGNWKQSHELLKKTITEKPEESSVLYDTGVSSYKVGEYEKAISYFSKAAQAPHVSQSLQEQALFNMGNSYVSLKELQKAIDAYDQVLALNSKHEKAAHNKEVVKKMLEQQKQKEQKKKDQNKDKDQKNEQQEKQEQDKQQEQNNDQKEQSDQKQQDEQKKQEQDESKDGDKKDGQQKEKPAEQKPDKKNQEEQDAGQKSDEQKSAEQEKAAAQEQEQRPLSPGLSRLLDAQEKKDAQLNRQLMRAMAASQSGGADYNEHCW